MWHARFLSNWYSRNVKSWLYPPSWLVCELGKSARRLIERTPGLDGQSSKQPPEPSYIKRSFPHQCPRIVVGFLYENRSTSVCGCAWIRHKPRCFFFSKRSKIRSLDADCISAYCKTYRSSLAVCRNPEYTLFCHDIFYIAAWVIGFLWMAKKRRTVYQISAGKFKSSVILYDMKQVCDSCRGVCLSSTCFVSTS